MFLIATHLAFFTLVNYKLYFFKDQANDHITAKRDFLKFKRDLADDNGFIQECVIPELQILGHNDRAKSRVKFKFYKNKKV